MQSLLAVLLLSVCALTSSAALTESRSADAVGCDLTEGLASFSSDLNVDVVFIVDVSQSMSEGSLIQASALVESVIDSLTLNPEFARWNGSDSNSTYWNMMDFAFAWNNTDNSTFNREFFEMLGTNLAYSWNNTDNNSTFNRDFFVELGTNLFSWNNTDYNSTFNREFFEMMESNLFSWNNTDNNSTFNRDFFVEFGTNLFSWNNTDNNTTFNREFFEMMGSNLFSWNNTDNNSTFNRDFFVELGTNLFSWNNTDNNTTFNREFFETLGTNLAYSWNNTDNNGTSTREFLELFTFNAVNAWNNYTDNNSTFGRNFFENFFNFPSNNHTGNYSRVGLVAVGETAEIIFDFSSPFNNSTNLTRSSASHADLRRGIAEALDIFARAPERSNRQMIYVISATPVAPGHPRFGRSQLHSAAAMFRREGGVIAVADMAVVPKPGLHNLASPGFYNVGLKDNVNVELQKICKAINS